VPDSGSQSITVSIVSHGQGHLVAALLEDLARCPNVSAVILTLNIPEDDIPCPEPLRPHLRVIRNERPLGFGANHNQAFGFCKTSLFAVLNPDIRLTEDPFPQLVLALETSHAGVIAPAVRHPDGRLEDSARHFPTLPGLLSKLLGMDDGRVEVKGNLPHDVDWTAGMFLIFDASVFGELGGFDESFFLYYEDVDICTRLWKSDRRVILHPGVTVIHAAQRTSRRKLRYMKWHLASMARYLGKYNWRLPR
jgi:N-acetylglucosaminyl-diphospho-decaprenol L-rhamnosyltransferase